MIEFLQVIADDATVCSYLADQAAKLPMCLPRCSVTRSRFDELMEAGYRRTGAFFYNTQCPKCSACEPLRLHVDRFQLTRSFRRVLQRAAGLRFELSEPKVDERRVELFNLHRHGRQLARHDSDVSGQDYQSFLMCAPNPSLELSIWQADKLISVAITDFGQNCLSAVYCCFNPEYSELSLGTLSILKQIELAQSQKMTWLYLGFYVAANQHLSYKARFRPHQRRICGCWQDFE
jgi:arginine-tRNA-protein transferase